MENKNKGQSQNDPKLDGIAKTDLNAKLKVMVIEDDVRMLGLYRRIFEQNGHAIVLEAETAGESLDKFKEALSANDGKRPSLVIADYRLPDGNGLEVSRELLKLDPDLE
ncbi:MAG: response regulator, partial [Nitrososphaerales archaeon]